MKKIKKQKRRKISILNILIAMLIFSLLFLMIFKNKENIQKMLPKIKRQKSEQSYSTSDLNIGDIVYYNHKVPQNDQDKTKQTVTIEKGTASTPGYGGKDTTTASQTFSAENENTTWRVWDKLPDGRVMLVSNRTVAQLNTGYGIGHIWWEHNAHKISSIFGYGYGADTTATKDFPYKVGSGIDNAPDMTEGDKGNWKIGQNGINISGARSLTLPDVEEKLGITEDKIKNGTDRIINNQNQDNAGPYYGNQMTITMNSVVQRDIGSSNQTWEDKTKAKAKNKGYKMTDRYYSWEKDKITEQNIPNIKYKEILFNQIDNWYSLATNALNVHYGGSYVIFGRGTVSSSNLGSDSFGFVYSQDSYWKEYGSSHSFRVVVYLQSKMKYFKAENEENAWDLQVPTVENKKVEIKNYQKLDFEPKINLVKDNKKIACVKENNRFVANVEYKTEIERQKTGDEAIFVEPTNKYIVEVENLPNGYTFEIEGIDNKEIDLKDKTSYTIIFKKNGTKLEDRDITTDDLNIGDIVYYNHKIADNGQNKSKQTVTIEPGSKSEPGYGGETELQFKTENNSGNFKYNANKYNTTWRIWDKLSDGRLMLVSNRYVANLFIGDNYHENKEIGHKWWEHNSHKICSIFGYGYGADTNATKDFEYKVGSGIVNINDNIDEENKIWKIGQNGINISGARSLTLPDVEEKLGITVEKIRNGENGIQTNKSRRHVDLDYGKSIIKNGYKMTDGFYFWRREDIPTSKYKNMLFNKFSSSDFSNWCGLATSILDLSNIDRYERGSLDYFGIGAGYLQNRCYEDGCGSTPYDQYPTFIVVTYLDSKIKYIKASGEDDTWDLGDTLDTKKIKVNMKNSGSKDVKVKTEIKAVSNVDLGGKNEYTSDLISNSQSSSTYQAKVKYGQKRTGSGDNASFTMYENKYNINIGIENLPLGHAYKVTGSKQGEINVTDDLEYNVEIWDKYNLTLKDILVRKNGKADINDGISNLPNGSSITLKNKDEIIKTNKIGEKEYEVIVKIGEDVYNEKIKVKVIDNVQISVKYINEMLKNVITDIEPYVINEKAEIKSTLNNQYYDCKIVENGKYNLKFKNKENLENVPTGFRNEGEYTVEYFGKSTNDEYIVLKKDGKEVGKKYLYKAGKKELGDEVKYDIYLKPVLKLPFTGKYISVKIVVYTLGISLLLGIAVRHRRKILVMFKNYNVMK